MKGHPCESIMPLFKWKLTRIITLTVPWKETDTEHAYLAVTNYFFLETMFLFWNVVCLQFYVSGVSRGNKLEHCKPDISDLKKQISQFEHRLK